MKHVFRATIGHGGESHGQVALGADEGRHLVRVARLGVGDGIEVIDAHGTIWPAVIEELGSPVRVRLGAAARPGPSPLPLDLYIGALEWGRFDLVVEKCTEVGVAGITMFSSERSGRKVDQEGFDKRAERLARLSAAAAKQSGQGHRPELRGLVPFPAVIASMPPEGAFLVDARGEQPLGPTLRAAAPEHVSIVVGSDAGFSDTELAAAREKGIGVCSLGATTLRAETAAIVAVAIAADGLGTAR